MNKRLKVTSSLLLSLLLSVSLFYTAQADDTAGNVEFTARKQKVTCMSVPDVLNLKEGYFLVFDYSPQIGKSLGRPWSVVESGKCYEIDTTGGTMYLARGGEQEKKKYNDYKLYKPEQDFVEDNFIQNDRAYEGLTHPVYSAFKEIIIPVPDEDRGLGESAQDIYLTMVDLPSLIPTKYSFGERITYSSSLGFETYQEQSGNDSDYPDSYKIAARIIKDPRYSKDLYGKYLSLAKSLEKTLNTCDNRSRVEYQFWISSSVLRSQVWKLKDGTEKAMPEGFKKNDALTRISEIGCADVYKDFIVKNTYAVDEINQIALQILKDNNITSNDQTITSNKETEGRIFDFLAGKRLSYTHDYESGFSNFPWLPEFMHQTTGEQNGNSLINQPGNITVSSVLEEPTPEKKTEAVIVSKSPFIKVYMLLPLCAFVGIVLFIIAKKRKK